MGLANAVVTGLLRIGVPMGPMALLTVPGRKSGLPRTTPIAIGQRGGERWVISPYGEVDWVRNLRAAGQATLTRARRVETIRAQEVPPAEAASLLKHSLASAPAMMLTYFEARPTDPVEAFAQDALKHPVFRFLPLQR
jgi:deazaflavin-dependent oxidoreductase (nitroreductase family)